MTTASLPEPPAADVPAARPAPAGAHPLAAWWDLVLIRLHEVRDYWYWLVIGWLVFPGAILFFMKTATAGDPAMATYLVTGNAVVSLVINTVQMLASDLAWARQRKDLDFFATLPVSRLQLVLAFVAHSALLSVPGALLNVLAGAWLLGMPLDPVPLFPAVVLLSVLSMVGVGVMVGVTARSGTQANVVNNLILVLTMFLSPVMVPAERLPQVLQAVGALLPPTYAADALRGTLGLGDPGRLPLDLAVLAGWAVVTGYLAVRHLEWRRD